MSQTQILRYESAGQASLPPLELYFTLSPVVAKDVISVGVRVIPEVGKPAGSLVARQNSMPASAATDHNDVVSVFFRLKSLFSTSICDLTWSSDMFSATSLYTMCTTTGIVIRFSDLEARLLPNCSVCLSACLRMLSLDGFCLTSSARCSSAWHCLTCENTGKTPDR